MSTPCSGTPAAPAAAVPGLPGARPLLPVVGAGLAGPARRPAAPARTPSSTSRRSAPALQAVADASRRGPAVVRQRAPRRRLRLPGQHRAPRAGPRRASRGSSAPAPTTRSSSPATPRTRSASSRGACPPAARVLVLDASTTPNLLPWQRQRRATRAATPPTWRRARRAGRRAAARPVRAVGVTGAINVTGEALPLEQIVAVAHAARRPGRRRRGPAGPAPGLRRWPRSAPTGSPSPGTSSTRLTVRVRSSAARTGWTPAEPYLAGGGAVADGRRSAQASCGPPAPPRHEGGRRTCSGAVGAGRRLRRRSTAWPAGALEQPRASAARVPGSRPVSSGCPACACCASGPTRASRSASSASPSTEPTRGCVAAFLSAEHGIGVRDGRFCAHPLLARLGVPDGALRASVGVGTDADGRRPAPGRPHRLPGRRAVSRPTPSSTAAGSPRTTPGRSPPSPAPTLPRRLAGPAAEAWKTQRDGRSGLRRGL